MDGPDAALQEIGARTGAVLAAITEQLARLRQERQESCGLFVIVDSTLGERKAERPALSVSDDLQLGAQAAAGVSGAERLT